MSNLQIFFSDKIDYFLTHPQAMVFITITSISITLICSLICLVLLFRMRSLTKYTVTVTDEMGKALNQLNSNLNQELSSANKTLDSQSCRLAWLETRVRREPVPVEPMGVLPTKPSVTEKRHRVLSLAKRGLDSDAIANQIGVPHGEVELIIGLQNIKMHSQLAGH